MNDSRPMDERLNSERPKNGQNDLKMQKIHQNAKNWSFSPIQSKPNANVHAKVIGNHSQQSNIVID